MHVPPRDTYSFGTHQQLWQEVTDLRAAGMTRMTHLAPFAIRSQHHRPEADILNMGILICVPHPTSVSPTSHSEMSKF